MNDIDALEEHLLALGQRELVLERQLQALRVKGRAAVASGDEALADTVWSVFEDVRRLLSELQKEIAQTEIRLYSWRRRLRK